MWDPADSWNSILWYLATACLVSRLPSASPLILGLHLLVRLRCAWKMQLPHHWLCLFEIGRSRHWSHAWVGVGFFFVCLFVLGFLFSYFWCFSFLRFPFSFLSCLPLPSTLRESILDVPHRRADGPLAAYHAFHQTTKGSKHVYTDSCAPLLNSILCGISGDWHVLCPSERVHLLKSATAGQSFFFFFFPLLPYETDRNETERDRMRGGTGRAG